MFYQDLFIIDSQKIEEGHAVFTITLNPQHKIYKGHFPGDGITPGVCILQIASDLFSIIQQQNFVISSMKSVKFMQLIRPAVTPKVTFEFSYQPRGTLRCQMHGQSRARNDDQNHPDLLSGVAIS